MESKVYNLQLTQSELQTVINGLVMRPFSEVALLIDNLQKQIKAQEETPSEPAT